MMVLLILICKRKDFCMTSTNQSLLYMQILFEEFEHLLLYKIIHFRSLKDVLSWSVFLIFGLQIVFFCLNLSQV